MKKTCKFLCILCSCFGSIFAFADSPIYLIWLGLPSVENSWEDDWIREITSAVATEIQWVMDPNYEIYLDRAIIVTSMPDLNKYQNYLKHTLKRAISLE